MDKIKGKLHVSPFLLVMISFIVVILVGSFLIVTPIAQTSGKWGNSLWQYHNSPVHTGPEYRRSRWSR